jgi:RNA polymerase sigma-70 factor (ECF subfamily)
MELRSLYPHDSQWYGYSDDMLIKKFQETGNTAYFAILFQRYQHLVYGTCRKYVHKPEECQDLCMSVFEIALEKLPDQKIHSFNHWIYSVCRNVCISWLRKQEKTKEELQEWKNYKKKEEGFMENEAFLRLCNEGRFKTSQEELLSKAMLELNESQQVCLRLFFFEHLSYQMIQKKTGFTAKEVKTYLQNGKRRLRSILRQMID